MDIELTKTPKNSLEKNFWYSNANNYINIENESDKDKIDFFQYLLDQFNKQQYDKHALIQANIIENIEATNFALIVHTSIYSRHKFYDKTIQYLKKIEERKKTDDSIMSDYDLRYNYGRENYAAGRYDDAISYWLQNFKQNQKNARVNHFLGMSYLAKGDIETAKKYFVINSELNDKDQMEFINYSIRELSRLSSNK
jgi:tetratricopeptide (TPR) repeat protein